MLDAWRARRRRRLRRARVARGGDALQARHRALVLPRVRQARPDRARARLGRLPADGPRAARRAARDARAQPLPARDDRVGRLHADRGRLPARGARRRARRSSRPRRMLRFAFDAITSFSHAPLQAATLLGFVFSIARLPRDPAHRRRALRGHLRARRADHDRDHPAARRDPADHGRDHRRVRRAHLRRGQAPAAVRRARARQRAERAGPAGARRHGREDRRPRRRRVRARRRAPARARRPRRRRLRALARPRRPGGDARRRRRPPARALLPPPVHLGPHIAALFAELGMPDAIEWRAVERRVLRARARCTRSSPRSTCCASRRSRRSRACGWAPRCSRSSASRATARRTSAITARDWIERRMGRAGVGRGLGPAAARQVRRRAPTTSRWSGCGASCGCGARSRGEDVRQERLGYPRDSWEPLFARARALDRGRGRARADRPPGGAAWRARAPASRCTRARRTRSARGHDPRAFARRRRASATTACSPPSRTTSSSGCSTRRSRPRWARRTSRARAAIEYFAALCLLLELDRAVQPVLLDQRRRPRAPVRRADRAHELRRARALRRPPLPLRRELPAARPRAARARRRTRCSRATSRGCARSTRRSRATGCGARGASPSPPRSRSSRSATRTGSRRCARRRPASCSRTRRRSIPRTAARTTPCGWGAGAASRGVVAGRSMHRSPSAD